jgi:very-short-patch-repair endonuclease
VPRDPLWFPPVVRHARVSAAKRELAREYRRSPTPSERAAWQLLRNRRCHGLKFRRQQPIRGYIVDFYCAEVRLAVEIDGPVHDEDARAWYDFVRELRLADQGVFVIHLAPQDVPRLPEIIGRWLAAVRLCLDEAEAGS